MAEKITPQAKRLAIVFEESEANNMREFGKLIGVSYATVSRVLSGTQAISIEIVKGVCYKLGYSPEWFILGTGKKKAGKGEAKLVNELSLLRIDLQVMLAKNQLLEARMKGYENEFEDLKKLVQKAVQNTLKS